VAIALPPVLTQSVLHEVEFGLNTAAKIPVEKNIRDTVVLSKNKTSAIYTVALTDAIHCNHTAVIMHAFFCFARFCFCLICVITFFSDADDFLCKQTMVGLHHPYLI